MSATIAIAKNILTDRIFHIDNVDKTIKAEFECCESKQKLSPVKTEARGKDWHFRHLQNADIAKCRSTALHDLAIQLIMENAAISISKKLRIAYSNPRKEVTLHSKRSYVTVKYENEDVHFEVFVTHDSGKEKIDIYKIKKIKCVRIDLSEPELLTASPERINETVLQQYKNKSVVYWQDEIYLVSQYDNEKNWRNILLGLLAVIGLGYLFRKLFPKKKSR